MVGNRKTLIDMARRRVRTDGRVATRKFTYAEQRELEDEILGTKLRNADRLRDGGHVIGDDDPDALWV